MNGMAFLIPIALLMGLSALAAFFWSLESGQYEDLDGAAMRVLIDDAEETPEGDPEDRPTDEQAKRR